MRLLVINLETAHDRLRWIASTFDRLGLEFERLAAVDKNHLDQTTLSKVTGSGWSSGEVACFLSHIEAWKKVANGPDKYGCIFEDDVHLSPDAPQFLQDANWIPDDVDLIKLETTLNPVRTRRGAVGVGSHKLVPLKSFHNGSAGYIISKKRAAELIAALKVDRPVDDFLFDQGAYWQLVPALCIQDMFLPGGPKTLPSSLESGRQAVVTKRRRWRPGLTKAQKCRREVMRLLRQIFRRRGAIIPYGSYS